MTTVLIILGIFASIGALYAFSKGDGVKGAAAGALGGTAYGIGCIIQLLIPAIMILAGFWLLGKIFG